MKKLLLALAAIAMTVTAAAAQDTRTQIGRLSCIVDPGIGFVLGSSKDMSCTFHRRNGNDESYEGTIDKLGFDIGFTGKTRIEWIVFSVRDADVRRGSLAGTYVGASHEVTLGLGLGANWLVGGSKNGYALQPWSVQGQVGLNYSWTFTRLTLD
jgi:hypothetical protein